MRDYPVCFDGVTTIFLFNSLLPILGATDTMQKEKEERRDCSLYGYASVVMSGDGKITNSPLELSKPNRYSAFHEPLKYLPQKKSPS